MSSDLPVIGAHVGVMDEADLLPLALAHLRRIGVGPIVVHDMGSTDGTRDWLARAAQEDGALNVVDAPQGATEASEIALFAETVRGMRADWVLMLDADEFPLPRSGDLRLDMAAAEGAEVTLQRYNVALGPDGPLFSLPARPETYGEIQLYVRRDPQFRLALRENPTDYWLRGVPNPKMVVRPAGLKGFGPGMHALQVPGANQRRPAVLDGVVIAHLALSSYPRFARKIDNVRALFADPAQEWPENFGWHWRRWVELAEADQLRAEYDRSVCPPNEIEQLRGQGLLQSAAEVLSPTL